MHRDPTLFRNRFKIWKEGKDVYEAGLPKFYEGEDAIRVGNYNVYPSAIGASELNVTTPEVIVTGTDRRPMYQRYDAENSTYDPNAIRAITDWAPGIGDVSQAFDAYNAFKDKDYLQAGVLGSMLLLPSAIKKATKSGKTVIKNIFSSIPKTDEQWDRAYFSAIKNNDLEEVLKLRDLHFVSKTPNTKVVNADKTPTKTYHTVADTYDPNFNEFNPTIEGTHSAIYTSDSDIMSGTYSSKPVSEKEKDYYAELIRQIELDHIKNGVVSGDLAELRKAILSDPERGREWVVRNTWLNNPVELNRQKQLYLNLQNPVIIDGNGNTWNNVPIHDLPKDVYEKIHESSLFALGYTTRDLEAAQKAAGQYDGAIILNIYDVGASRKSPSIWKDILPSTVYLVNSPKNLKLADAITYDDAGNIIPLSKRDDFNVADIRYAIAPVLFGGVGYSAYNNLSYSNGKDSIHIKPSKRGTFTAAAKKHGKSVQQFASQVLANKSNYSPAMVKKANFAKNASKWNR